jgi:hypothetical protein
MGWPGRPPRAGQVVGGRELITPNPKLKLLDQVREVMRLKHYAIRTERSYCDWIRRYIKFHQMRSRDTCRAPWSGSTQMQPASGTGSTCFQPCSGKGSSLYFSLALSYVEPALRRVS